MNQPVILSERERLDEVNQDIKLIQVRDGLTFGTDAYLLAAYMSDVRAKTAVELGGGTGIISLLTASRGRAEHIVCAEVQSDFCELIRRNAALNHLDHKLCALHADVRDMSASSLGFEAEVVFSNPPYMKTDSGKRNVSDAKYIARHEVFGGIYDFCRAADRLLKFGGKFFCVWRPDRLADLMDAMRQNHLEPKRMTFVHADWNATPSSVLVEAKKGASPSLILTPPLILYHPATSLDGARELTDEAANIYRDCSFSDFFKKKG